MESEFEPAVRTEETPEARIVFLHVPGFRRENLRVQVNNQGNLIISGERGVKEMGEITKVGTGRLEKMQSGEQRFKKVMSVLENVNIDEITARLQDQVLRVTLPFIQKNQKSLTEDVNGVRKPDERSSPVKQQLGLMQDRFAAAEHHEIARLPEVIRPDHSKAKAKAKAKASAGAEESKAESPKHPQDFVHGLPATISTHTQATPPQAASTDRDRSQILQPEPKPRNKEGESCFTSPDYDFPANEIQVPASFPSRRSMFSEKGLLIASTVIVLGAYMYLSYILRSQKADRKPI